LKKPYKPPKWDEVPKRPPAVPQNNPFPPNPPVPAHPANTPIRTSSSSSSSRSGGFFRNIPTVVYIAVPLMIFLLISFILIVVSRLRKRSRRKADAELAAGKRVFLAPGSPPGMPPAMPFVTTPGPQTSYPSYYPMNPSAEYPILDSPPSEAPPAYFDPYGPSSSELGNPSEKNNLP